MLGFKVHGQKTFWQVVMGGSKVSLKLPLDPRWVKSRQKLVNQIKQQIESRYGSQTAWIGSYQKEYFRDFFRPWRIAKKSDLIEEIQNSDVVFGGDFHAFPQAQRTHMKILRSLPVGQTFTLALEVLPSEKNDLIQAYVEGRISESDFLKKIDWDNQWGFKWENYRPLIEIARKRNSRVIGLGPSPAKAQPENPKSFDRYAARVLKKTLSSTSDLVYVIAGDFHIARGHLPKALRALYKGAPPREVIVYLNPERIYFQLARRGLENQVDVIKFNRRHFCVMGSPPWVKWQSYLMYLEENYDHDLEEDFEEDDIDYTDHVTSVIRFIARDLGLKIKTDKLQVFTLNSHNLDAVLEKYLDKEKLELADELLETNRSFFLPNAGVIVLAQTSVNHAAALAGQFIHAQISRRKTLLWNMPNEFKSLIWVEAIGFFISKLVNHKRHAQTLTDLKEELAVMHPKDKGRDALLLALDYRMKELVYLHEDVEVESEFKPSQLTSYIEAARFLGGMLGERIYLAYRSRRMKRQFMLKLLSRSPSKRGFEEFYILTLKELEKFKPPIKSRKERL